MKSHLIRLYAAIVVLLVLSLLRAEPARGQAAQIAANGPGERVVYQASALTDEEIIVVSAAVAASGKGSILLFDTPAAAAGVKDFIETFRPARTIPVGKFVDGRPAELWKQIFPLVKRVVVCAPSPRSQLLQAACLAGALPAPLWILHDQPEAAENLQLQLKSWGAIEILAVGDAASRCREFGNVRCTELVNARAVADAYLQHQLQYGPIETLVVANPLDHLKGMARTSCLAPWLALQRHAALVLTNPAGDNTDEAVRAALKDQVLRQAGSLILAGDLRAIPMHRRPNPVKGKDALIEMEPLTPEGSQPCSFATGRLFHFDRGVLALILARQRLLAENRSPPKALVASNPGGGLPLLEVFSRHTSRELQNAGYRCTALFGEEINPATLRHLLPQQDVFLWEGHYKTMVDEYGLPAWTEPLRPSLIFLQSCLALNEAEAHPLLRRGAVALVGSSTRTYSATGGAFTLAFFDALLYDNATLGGSMRQAKNFLLAYALLKDQRLGEKAQLSGANVRSAWAFTLWGDPTLRLPRSAPPENALPAVRHTLKKNTLTLTLPEKTYDRVTSAKYQMETWPNARLAGLLTRDEDGDDVRQLVPLVFAEVRLVPPAPGLTPRLESRLAERRWVFCWDGRREYGYLLVVPPADGRRELRFNVHWEG